MPTYFEHSAGRVTKVHDATGAGRVLATDDNVAPGWYYDGRSLSRGPILTNDTKRLRAVALACHEFLVTEVETLNSLSSDYPQEDINYVKDVEYRFHQGVWAVFTRAAYTTNQKLTFGTEFIKGSADIADVEGLLNAMPTIRGLFAAPPTHPVVWVDPRTGTRWRAAEARTKSGPGTGNLNLIEPARGTLRNGAWIDSLVAA